MKRQIRHRPVLLESVLRRFELQPGQVVVDCTLGLAGHAEPMLRAVMPTGRLIAFEFDQRNIEIASARLAATGGSFHIHHGNFAALATVLSEQGTRADAILADLGVSSPQLDDPARGFSYKFDGPLDMRMDPTRSQTAADLVNTLTERQLRDALLEFGDETDAPKIARLIVRRRAIAPITKTRQLMELVCEARDFTVDRAFGAKLHPATRTFQALRILTNREMGNLENLLRILPDCLKPGGIAGIISFHSGEDRRVKHAFRTHLESGQYEDISDDPITATAQEVAANPRSRSAKLRWARRA